MNENIIHTNQYTELIGQIVDRIEASDDSLTFFMQNGDKWRMEHFQECCESVYIESIVGDLANLTRYPLLMAEEVIQDDPEASESGTWTFYKFATIKGYVDIRWYGGSNGYYSERVSFYKEMDLMEYRKIQKFLPVLKEVANLSKDRSTKVGAVALGLERNVLGIGYNGFPKLVDDEVEERHERPAKYLWTAHAEENLIAQCAKHGVSLQNATLLLFPLLPCAACARMIIQSGISEVVVFVRTEDDLTNPRWQQHFEVSEQMFKEAGVKFYYYVESDSSTVS